MKYCTHCGAEIADEAVVCVKCGCAVESQKPAVRDHSTLDTVIKVFMIIGCVANAFCFLIPLCWCIPMTLHLINERKAGAPIGTGFKICVLLFVNTIAGILLLCREEDDYLTYIRNNS